MIKVYDTQISGSYEVEFIHPDTGVEYHNLAIVNDDIWDDNFSVKVCEQAWNMYNSSGYYHEMIIRSEFFIRDIEKKDYLFIHETHYNGCEITEEKCAKRYICYEAPFEQVGEVIYDKEK